MRVRLQYYTCECGTRWVHCLPEADSNWTPRSSCWRGAVVGVPHRRVALHALARRALLQRAWDHASAARGAGPMAVNGGLRISSVRGCPEPEALSGSLPGAFGAIGANATGIAGGVSLGNWTSCPQGAVPLIQAAATAQDCPGRRPLSASWPPVRAKGAVCGGAVVTGTRELLPNC